MDPQERKATPNKASASEEPRLLTRNMNSEKSGGGKV
jgi:hypothetical protein